MKKQLSVRIDSDLLETIRDIVYWDPSTNLNRWVEDKLQSAIKDYDYVEPRHESKLKTGRKIQE